MFGARRTWLFGQTRALFEFKTFIVGGLLSGNWALELVFETLRSVKRLAGGLRRPTCSHARGITLLWVNSQASVAVASII